jgi:hypothetical protein
MNVSFYWLLLFVDVTVSIIVTLLPIAIGNNVRMRKYKRFDHWVKGHKLVNACSLRKYGS